VGFPPLLNTLSLFKLGGEAKRVKPLPYPFYFGTVCLLAVLGLANALYLSISHYRLYTDISYASICAVTQSLNCDTVSQSPYAIFGGLPVPLWGVIGYAFFLMWTPFAWSDQARKGCLWHLFLSISVVFGVVSVVLALVSTFLIKSYCLLCMASYAINLALCFSCWITIRRFSRFEIRYGIWKDLLYLWSGRRRFLPALVFLILASVSLKLGLPPYWKLEAASASSRLTTGVTAEGHPWIGAEHPDITITEFTDYQCFQCRKMHYFLRHLISENPDSIRLVHRHFPMDNEFNPLVEDPFHVGSGSMALLAAAAASLGKFWEANDYLFQQSGTNSAISVKEVARNINVDAKKLSRLRYDQGIQMQLWQDITDGIRLKITGTPAYLIEKELYLGQIPSHILKKVTHH
jgi:uncharacterized membrane protein/protein-disulfide isomerase